MSSPPLAALTPPSSLAVAVQDSQFVATVGSDDTDRAWSEYNHHWAGLIVLIAGLLALLSRHRTMRWARFWPLSFAGLAVFILLRADPENWPLGPRPFWQSFAAPDVLQHRVGALLIVVFAAFECAVQAGQVESAMGHLCFSGNVCSRCGAVADTRAFGQGRERSNACRDEPHPYCVAWYYGGMQPMAGAAFTQEPHGHHCQLSMAAMPGVGRPCFAELPRIAVAVAGRVEMSLNLLDGVPRFKRENQNRPNSAGHNCRRRCRIAGRLRCCEFAADWYGSKGFAL